jgi:hypothetical protein
VSWAPDYLTLAQAREYLRVPAGQTTDDAWITELVSAASRAIDKACRRQFGSAPAIRVYESSLAVPDVACTDFYAAGVWRVPVDDVVPGTEATVRVGTALVDPVVWLPRNAPADATPYTALRLPSMPDGDIEVTTTFGWAQVPPQVPNACRLQLGRWFARRQSPAGIAGSPTDGSEARLLDRLDSDVMLMLAGLTRARMPR